MVQYRVSDSGKRRAVPAPSQVYFALLQVLYMLNHAIYRYYYMQPYSYTRFCIQIIHIFMLYNCTGLYPLGLTLILSLSLSLFLCYMHLHSPIRSSIILIQILLHLLHLKLVYQIKSSIAQKLKLELSSYISFLLFLTSSSSTQSHSASEVQDLIV